MKILITGGAGYKGVVLAKSLLEKGYKVTIYDNFMYGFEPVLHLMDFEQLEVKNIDIRNIKESDLKSFDIIYHLAGISGYPACEANPHSAKVINVDATEKMIKLLSKDQLIIYASTTSFYGKDGKDCDEDSPISPVSLYGITKYEAEKIIMEKENSISLRFATVFGVSPKMRTSLLLNDFTYKAINDRTLVIFDGHSKRTFIHIKDAINAYVFTLENIEKMRNNIYNVGSNEMNFSKLEIAEAIKKYVNFEIINSSLPDVDLRNFVISFKKIEKLGYKVKYTLDDGIRELLRLYSFYKSHQDFRFI